MPEDSVSIAKIARADRPNGQARAESEVRQSLDDWIDAVNSGFADSISALYMPNAVLLPTFDPKILTSAAERYAYFVKFKTRRGLRATIEECHIDLLDNDAGMASGLYTFRFLSEDNAEQIVKARFTFVFTRQPEGDWLITTHHSSVTPSPL